MPTVHFLKGPGFVYDILFLFSLKFNKEKHFSHFSNIGKPKDQLYEINKLLESFEPISIDLLPFFYLKGNNLSFMTQHYFDPFVDRFTDDYSISVILQALSNYDAVIDNLLRFYFQDISDKTITECKRSLIATGRLIKDSDYNSDVKSCLYSFFLEPITTIQKLTFALVSLESQYAFKHEKIHRKISKLQEEFDFDRFHAALDASLDMPHDFDSFDQIYVSFCDCVDFCIRSFYCDNRMFIILGTKYTDALKYLAKEHCTPKLDLIGNALSEQNRIDILDLAYEKGEITIRDIEQELGFSGTNAYYHLSLMIKANIIRSRNQGRTVLYSVNKSAFSAVCDLLSKYTDDYKKGDHV